ncbi:hypothetical protein FBU30_000877 [Linnemannia zychae]|nr:hypothetical protein FBU30_000877 [Linnemannia zychae]
MVVPNYGVWVATPISFAVERHDLRTPHIYLRFKNNPHSTIVFEAAINVKSLSAESRLVYWPLRNLDNSFTNNLKTLERGFNPSPPGPGLDYIRTDPPLFDIGQGRILEHNLPGPDNDIIDIVSPILRRAIMSDNTIMYIFGSQYPRKDGIHDIHMNQGSLPRFDNGVGQDGGIFFYYPDEDRWDAIFLAFASQKIPTNNNNGFPEVGSQELAYLLGQ